jgi:hypothetical protein
MRPADARVMTCRKKKAEYMVIETVVSFGRNEQG